MNRLPWAAVCGVALHLCLSWNAQAQPTGPAQPAAFIDLGPVAIGDSVDSGEVDLPPDKFVWFRFQLLEGVTQQTAWMDMDTYGPNVIQNSEIALYDTQKNFVATDNDSGGSGPSGNNYAAAMSFGAGSGLRLTLAPLGGTLSDGFSLGNLDAGVYWVCVAAYDATFEDPNNFWVVNTTSTATGKVRLKISTGRPRTDYWNERWEGQDAGILPSSAITPEGEGELRTIMCAFSDGPRSVDTFRIRVCDPAFFRVESEATTVNTDEGGGGNWGTRLYLFDDAAQPLLGVDRETNNGTTVLQPLSPSQLTPGDYYLSVTTNCNGSNGWVASPYGAAGPMFLFDTVASNQTVAPNGPGAGQPVVAWGRIGNCNSAGAFITRLTLTGACYVTDDAGCPADIAPPFGVLNFFDVVEYLSRYNAGCP